MASARSRRRAPTRAAARLGRSSRRRGRAGRPSGLVLAVVMAFALAAGWLADRPGLLTGLLIALLAVAVVTVAGWAVWGHSQRRRRAALTRSVAEADRLSGPEFEHWVADLMRRTGFTRVQVSGGAGDLGADIIALAPTGWRVVVQCKRYRVGRTVGSPDVQKLAGTAGAIHEAEVAAIVTTSSFTAPARDAAARLGISLVDRDMLARWATDGLLPVALARPAPPATGPAAAPPLPDATGAARPPSPRSTR